MPNDVFTPATDQSTGPSVSQTTVDSVRASLVGEGKKYASDEDMAKAYVNADTHIGTLTSENQQLREQLAERQSVTDALEELKRVQIAPNQSQLENTTPVLDEGKIADLVAKTVQSLNTDGVKKVNREEASQKMLMAWGGEEGSRKVLLEKATVLGVSEEFLRGVAESSPAAFYQLVGLAGTTTGMTQGTGTVADQGINTGDGQGPTGLGGTLTENDWAFWQNMRKTDRKKWQSTAQVTRRHALVAAGELKPGG